MGSVSEIKDIWAKEAAEAIAAYVVARDAPPLVRTQALANAFEKLVRAMRNLQSL